MSSGWGSWDTKRLTWIPTGYVTSSLRTQTRAQTAGRGVQMVLGDNSVMWQRSVHPGLETRCRYCTHQASSTSSSRVCRTRDWRSCGDLRPQWWSGRRVLSVSKREVERGQVIVSVSRYAERTAGSVSVEPTLSPAEEGRIGMDGNRYVAHTAGSVSGEPTLSPAGEGIDGNRYAEHTAGSVSRPTLSPADGVG